MAVWLKGLPFRRMREKIVGIKLDMLYRVLSEHPINADAVLREANVEESIRAINRLQLAETLTHRYIGIEHRRWAHCEDLAAETIHFAQLCRAKFAVFFDVREIQVHELYGAVFHTSGTPAPLLWLKQNDLLTLHALGFGLALNFYPPE